MNRKYFELRRRGSAAQRQALSTQLSEKKAELEDHEKAKPSEVAKPAEQNGDDTATVSLAKVVEQIEDLESELAALRKQEEMGKKRLAAIDRIVGRIANLRAAVEGFYEDSATDFALVGFDPRQVVELKEDSEPLKEIRRKAAEEVESLRDALDHDHPGSKAHARAEASKEADRLRQLLDEPQRRYQEYERALSQWRRRGAEIRGAEDKPDSVAGL